MLIMIFAALLSASFITVVSVNLNQTARQADKNRAAASAKAGLDYINRQLAFSADGENWRPQIPTANLAAYYTPLDRAQGWAGSYAKFPNPLDEQGNNNGPQFLAKIERIPFNLTSASADFDKAGQLKITVIGLSPEDPTAYSRTVFYKGGYQNAPIAQNMRVVSNWDFKNGVVPVAQAGSWNNTSRVVTLTNIKGNFPEPPFAVMIGDPRSVAPPGTPKIRGGVVVAKTATTFTFGYPNVSLAIDTKERIELAASIGSPIGLNYNNDANNASPGAITNPVRMTDNNTAGGVRINGGLWLTGKAFSDSLRAPADAYGPTVLPPASIQTSGMLGRDLPASITEFRVQGQGIVGTNNDLVSSNGTSFPGGWTGSDRKTKDQLVSDAWNRLSGVPSGSRPPGNLSTFDALGTRSVTSFIPPSIDGGEGLERYRNLTRFSPPANPTDAASVSLYGSGQGIYIDNSSDKEQIYVTNEDANGNGTLDAGEDVNNDGFLETKTGFREMRQAELTKMWVSRPLPNPAVTQPAPPAPPILLPATDYMRTGTPAALNSTTASLEQQHLRSWVGPEEFRGRGAEVVLGNDPAFVNPSSDPLLANPSGAFLTVIRDARDDKPANIFGGVTQKTWKAPATGAEQPGKYSRTFAWPQNGVLFAEGNVRIRGTATDAPKSLTVVSLGNIYIEGTLQLLAPSTSPLGYRNKKVLLLATKNVVMNPTRVLGRPDSQTATPATPTTPQPVAVGPGATLDVEDGLTFQIGDFIQASTITAGTETPVAQGYITSAPTATRITFTAVLGGNVPPRALVRTPNSLVQTVASASTTPPKNISFTSVANGTDVVQRRLNLPNPLPANLRLAFDHQGNRVPAFVAGMTVTSGTINNDPILFSNKGIFTVPPATTAPFLDATATVVAQSDKKIRGQYTQPVAGVDDFPGTVPSNPSAPATPTTDAQAQAIDLTTLSGAMNATPHSDNAPTPNTWNYSTSLPTAAYSGLPFFYLAGVGNRLDFPPFTADSIPSGLERRFDIRPTAYQVPLATSISLFTNGAQSLLSNEHWNAALATPRYDQVNQFGFSPNYLDASNPSEDVLTGDQSFYQTDPIKSTLDSRQLTTGLVPGPNSLFLRQSNGIVPLTAPAVYPEYRLNGLKLENVGLKVISNEAKVDTINPAVLNITDPANPTTFNVNAFVYAQTGSWFVIPGGLFDDRLKTINPTATTVNTFLDINNNGTPEAGESIADGTTGNSYPDLNRNGIVDDAERYAMARYSRYNYQINFNGAISEGQTPIINSMRSGPVPAPIVANGAVEAWMLSWSTIKKDSGVATPTNGRMTYTFDSDYVRGLLFDDPSTPLVDETDIGFRLPQTTEVFNVS
ncbi:hypothetical protein [Abditibacterium utsteinense]|uniref:hypothetical protein n=1 Tax=Abditibacterium utsteinense TaxID=1960156 RepID=UPI000F49E84F|nr:hypothetical protein [Abditibacterium utsteinense]